MSKKTDCFDQRVFGEKKKMLFVDEEDDSEAVKVSNNTTRIKNS